MRISRGCYDKFHRCPGHRGGGMKYAKVQRCEGGRIGRVVHDPDHGRYVDPYEGRWWRWRVQTCDSCDVVVLPFVTRYLDPTFVPYALRTSTVQLVRNVRDDVQDYGWSMALRSLPLSWRTR